LSLFAPKKNLVDLKEIRDALLNVDIYACDLETTGFNSREDRITIVALACKDPETGEIKGWAIETRQHSLREIREVLGPVFSDPRKTIVFHNANFDLQFLNFSGVYFKNKLADTMVMAWLWREDRIANGGGHGLKHCVARYLNYKMSSYNEARSLFGDMDTYAADDAVQTLRLYDFYVSKLTPIKVMNWFENIEMKITRVLIEMETRGVALSKAQLKSLKKDAIQRVEDIEKVIHKKAGYQFVVSSPTQLAKVLFVDKKLGMSANGKQNKYSHKGKSEEWSTNEETLKAMQRAANDPRTPAQERKDLAIASDILKFREINTRLNTFIRPLLDRCYYSTIIHPRFLQIGTVSGRFASRDPNYQNLPRKGGVRRAFVAREGYKIVKADYSQAELRLMAHFSGDPNMLRIYRGGGDIHQSTATACGVSRQAAKAINFGLIYRMSANRLQAQLAKEGIVVSIAQAKSYVKKYFYKYARVRKFHQQVERVVKKRLQQDGEFGWVKTLGGRYRRLDRNYLTGPETHYTAITQAINTTIQGGVSDLIKVAMVLIQAEFKERGWLDPENGVWDAYLHGQVHDEVFAECKEELAEEVAEIITKHMVQAGITYGISVPMNTDAEIVDSLAK
jgi:DNA polymerase-1